MKDFIDSIINNKETKVNGENGRMPVIMAMAAKKSHEEGRPVKLSEI